MDQCELNSNNDNSQGGKHNVKQKKKNHKDKHGISGISSGRQHSQRNSKMSQWILTNIPFFFSFFFHKWVTWEIFLKTHTGSIHSVLTKLQHGNVQRTARTTWSCQSSTAAAGQQDSTQGGWRCQCGILFFFFDHLPSCVSMETWRTLSSTWPGAGRNPTTQISA